MHQTIAKLPCEHKKAHNAVHSRSRAVCVNHALAEHSHIPIMGLRLRMQLFLLRHHSSASWLNFGMSLAAI
jgi:hypothetical protein